MVSDQIWGRETCDTNLLTSDTFVFRALLLIWEFSSRSDKLEQSLSLGCIELLLSIWHVWMSLEAVAFQLCEVLIMFESVDNSLKRQDEFKSNITLLVNVIILHLRFWKYDMGSMIAQSILGGVWAHDSYWPPPSNIFIKIKLD